MLPQYHDARHHVRNGVIKLVEDLAKINEESLQAVEESSVEELEKARKELKKLDDVSEKIDNEIVVIFAKFTPGAKDLREIVSYLKITSALNRVHNNIDSYLKNMQSILIEDNPQMYSFIKDSLRINHCTLKAFEYTIEMLKTFDQDDKIKKLASQIDVELNKTEDIYSILEKDMVQKMSDTDSHAGDYFNLLKYFRKNMKVIDRLETVAQRIIYARMGGKL